jgi:hypothetical protein
VAIAAAMLLDDEVAEKGVLVPVHKAIYDPILVELATLGIALEERNEGLA